MYPALKRFYFIRHGESLWNVKKLCQGQRDIALSDKGISEAEIFAEKFANFPVEHVCTSPLKRAVHTAEIIKQYHFQYEMLGFLLNISLKLCMKQQPSRRLYKYGNI